MSNKKRIRLNLKSIDSQTLDCRTFKCNASSASSSAPIIVLLPILVSIMLIGILLLTILPLAAYDVHASPLSMALIDTYQDNVPPDSIEGARGMQVDENRKIVFVSSFTAYSLTGLNISNPFNITVYGSISDSAPVGSLDGIWYGRLENNIFYAPSSVDSTTAWYNVSTGTFVFLNDTATDTAGAGSQQQEYDVAIVNTGSTKWLITGGRSDDTISSFNVTNPLIRPTVVSSFYDATTACSVNGMTRLYNIPGTTYVIVAASVDSYITLLNISAGGSITCIGSGYTNTAGAGSIQGFQDFYYDAANDYLYVPGTADGYLTILTNILSGTPTLVGSVAGLTNAYSIAVSSVDFDGKKYAFVGSTTLGLGVRAIDVTNPAAPIIASTFNQTSGTCTYNGVYSLYTSGDYLYATSNTDACFYSIKLTDNFMNITLSYPPDNYYNDSTLFVNLTFNATVTDDDGIVNCSLWTNYSGSWVLNQTQIVGGIYNVTSFNLTDLTNNTFIWSIQCYDIYSHSSFASGAYTVVLNWSDNPPNIDLLSPIQGYTNNAQQYVNLTFNASVSDDKGLLNCSLWTNYSGSWVLNQTQVIGGTSNITRFDLTDLTNKTFVWNIQCFDDAFKSSFSSSNRTVILNWNPALDTPPAVSLSSPPNNYFDDTSQYVNLTLSSLVTDDFGIVNCSLWTNYSGTWSLNQTNNVGGNINTTSFTLNNLTNKTFVWNVECFDNASQSAFDTGNRTVILNWTPPLVGNFSVQKYYISLGSGVTSGFVPFTGGQNGLYAVPFVTMRVSASTDLWRYFLPDIYFNATGVIVERNLGTGSVMDVIVNVVEFDPNIVRVQSGTFSLVSGSTAPSLSSNIDLSRSAMVFYYTSTDTTDDYIDNSIMGNISSINTLNFSTSAVTGTKSGHWYVFESLDGGFSVQRAMLTFALTSTSASDTVSFVDTSKTFLIASYTTDESSDDARDGSFYVNLVDSTTVTGTRLGVPSANIRANVFVVMFSGDVGVRRGIFSYPNAGGTASDTFSTVNLNKSMAWNPVLTSRMASDSTGNSIESAFQLLNLTSSTTIDGSRSETAGVANGGWEIIDWIPIHAPVIDSISVDDDISPANEIVLSAGYTRFINCTVTATDAEGAENIVNASATFYYYLNKTSDSDNNNVHYTNNSCSYVSSNSTSKTFLCGFNVYYFANNGTWNCNATVNNGLFYSASANNSTIINPLYALNFSDGISFGNVQGGIESSDIIANVTNVGNMPINISLQGYAISIGDNTGMNCSDNTNITITNIKFSTALGQTFAQKNPLDGAIQSLNITLQKPTSITPIINNTYWQIMPDPGSINRQCTGFIIFSAEAS